MQYHPGFYPTSLSRPLACTTSCGVQSMQRQPCFYPSSLSWCTLSAVQVTLAGCIPCSIRYDCSLAASTGHFLRTAGLMGHMSCSVSNAQISAACYGAHCMQCSSHGVPDMQHQTCFDHNSHSWGTLYGTQLLQGACHAAHA